jgi:hypothetical protein
MLHRFPHPGYPEQRKLRFVRELDYLMSMIKGYPEAEQVLPILKEAKEKLACTASGY